jgi:hypothetical protein
MTMWKGRARGARAVLMSLLVPIAMVLTAGTVAAAPPAPFSVDPGSLAFGDVSINTTSSQSFTVTTARKDAVLWVESTFGPYTVTGGDCLTTWDMQVPAGTSCSVDITFAPLTAGDWSGSLNVWNCATWMDVGGLPVCSRTHGSVSMAVTGAGVNPP